MSGADYTTLAARAELRRLQEAATRGEWTSGPLTDPHFVGKHAIDHIIGLAAVPARVYLDRTDAQGRTHHDRAAVCEGVMGDGMAAYLAGAATAAPHLLDALDARDALLRRVILRLDSCAVLDILRRGPKGEDVSLWTDLAAADFTTEDT